MLGSRQWAQLLITILLIAFTMWPWSSHTPDVRSFNAPLDIQISRTSPIFAAREDAQFSVIPEFPQQQLVVKRGQIYLHAGVTVLDRRIFVEPTRRSQLLDKSRRPYVAQGMTFERPITELTAARRIAEAQRRLAGLTLTRHDPDVALNFSTAPAQALTAATTEFSSADRETNYEINRQTNHETLETKLTSLLAHEGLVKDPPVPVMHAAAWTATVSRSPSGEQIIQSVPHRIRGPSTQVPPRVTSPALLFAQNIPVPQASPTLTPALLSQLADNSRSDLLNAKTQGLISAKGDASGGMIEGNIELQDGLAFFGSKQSMTVSQWLGGQELTRGQVSVQTGRYSITPSRPGQGELVAELRSPDGILMGRAQKALASVTGGSSPHDTKLFILPLSASVRGSIAAFVSPVPGALPTLAVAGQNEIITTDKKLNFKKAGYVAGSSYLLAAKQVGHRTSILLGSTEQSQLVRLFPNQIVDGWISHLMAPSKSKDLGNIYGQVLFAGKPVANAEVSIDDQNAKVIYLDSDQNANDSSVTVKNGSFAIVGVSPGLHAVGVNLSQADLGSGTKLSRLTRNVAVDADAVSFLELSPANKVSMTAFIYDAKTSQPLQSRITLEGEDKIAIADNGSLKLNIQSGEGYINLGFEAGPAYLPANQLCSRRTTSISVPMLRSDWMMGIEDQLGISRETGRGYIVGFIRGEKFILDEGPLAFDSQTRVAYFDESGKVIASRTDQAAAGFVVLNAPAGLQSIGVHLENHGEVANQVVVVKAGEASLIDWKF